MKTILVSYFLLTRLPLVILLLAASCAGTASALNLPAKSKGAARIPAAATPPGGNGGSGGQSQQGGRQVSVPRVAFAPQGQSGGGITAVTRVTRMSGSNQNARDFFRSGGLRLP